MCHYTRHQRVSSTRALLAVIFLLLPAASPQVSTSAASQFTLTTPASGGPSLPLECLTWATPTPSGCRFLVGFLPALSENQGQNKHFVGAFEYALKRINRDELADIGCRIDYETVDNKADTEESLRGMTSLYAKGAIAFIGPEDTCATEARLAAAWNLPMIAFVSRTAFSFNRLCHLVWQDLAITVIIFCLYRNVKISTKVCIIFYLKIILNLFL
jgi:hypothetical protein